jgi:DNA-binding transcriptional MerR regulator/effector-binding domain-containing protein
MKKYHIKLKIGEFSKLCYVTVKTLRHYEKLGLLIPHEVDEWTGYRYYDVSQMQELNCIIHLKQLGLSLEEIKDLKDDNRNNPTPEMIDKALQNANEELCSIRNRIAALEQLKGNAIKNQNMNNIVIKPLPGGIVASFRKTLSSYDELGPLCVNVIGPEMQRLHCVCPSETAYCFTIDYNRNFNPTNIDLEYCEIVTAHDADSEILKFRELPVEEKALCYGHRGSYANFGDSMSAVFKYIEENHLIIKSEPRFSYIHGVWDCDTMEDWLTEIQVPLK